MQHDIIALVIPPSMWCETEERGSRLKCVISINGTLMHLEAIQVRRVGRDRTLAAVHSHLAEDFALLERYASEGQFETTEINGHSYVLVAMPFC
jgi:hypothetical protein